MFLNVERRAKSVTADIIVSPNLINHPSISILGVQSRRYRTITYTLSLPFPPCDSPTIMTSTSLQIKLPSLAVLALVVIGDQSADTGVLYATIDRKSNVNEVSLNLDRFHFTCTMTIRCTVQLVWE